MVHPEQSVLLAVEASNPTQIKGFALDLLLINNLPPALVQPIYIQIPIVTNIQEDMAIGSISAKVESIWMQNR